eukprot:TRINITY_DN7998_c0_g1_i1.p1 TRINITY_DN7998_c0_g1~~TRINITY_DN7998_c0_g1_i1.p1  ORF type:complete len:470 (-),score=111.95 TRINITY_DN7998_c0_g1_i1:178-1587(-)
MDESLSEDVSFSMDDDEDFNINTKSSSKQKHNSKKEYSGNSEESEECVFESDNNDIDADEYDDDCGVELSPEELLYTNLKIALSNDHMNQLVGREKEQNIIRTFILDKLEDSSGAMYISGVPGTGKTATVDSVIESITEEGIITPDAVLKINCMSNKKAGFYTDILDFINPNNKKKKPNQANTLIQIKKNLSNDPRIFVLDEVDQLPKDKLNEVYNWPSLPGSRVIIIGISNQADLTHSKLPERHKRDPITLLHFTAYQNSQIVQIIKNRINRALVGSNNKDNDDGDDGDDDDLRGHNDVFDNAAITYIASKVGSFNGDIRKALDICKLALDVAFRADRDPLRVTIADMMPLVASQISQKLKTFELLPLHQKFIIVCIAKLAETGKPFNLRDVLRKYREACADLSIHVDVEEYMNLISNVADTPLVEINVEHLRNKYNLECIPCKLKATTDEIAYVTNEFLVLRNLMSN